MTGSLGPWATEASAGARVHLNTFWKKRLAMLPAVRRSGFRLGGWASLLLLGTAALVWALPTLCDSRLAATPAADAIPGSSAEPHKTADRARPDAGASAQHLPGIILDEQKRPVPGAEVRLYETDWLRQSERLRQKTLTGADGRFQLEHPRKKTLYKLTVSKVGFASLVRGPDHAMSPLFHELILTRPASLRGRVTGPDGQPIADADVWTPPFKSPVAGVQSAKTDAAGHFEIPDLAAWEDDGMPAFFSPPTPEQLAQARAQAKPGSNKLHLRVWHPDYGMRMGPYSRIPDTVNVSFDRPSIVTGRVVDRATGKPLSGIQIMLQGDRDNNYAQSLTDSRGAFRLLLQESGKCQLWLAHERRTTGRESEVRSGRTLDVSEIRVNSSEALRQPE